MASAALSTGPATSCQPQSWFGCEETLMGKRPKSPIERQATLGRTMSRGGVGGRAAAGTPEPRPQRGLQRASAVRLRVRTATLIGELIAYPDDDTIELVIRRNNEDGDLGASMFVRGEDNTAVIQAWRPADDGEDGITDAQLGFIGGSGAAWFRQDDLDGNHMIEALHSAGLDPAVGFFGALTEQHAHIADPSSGTTVDNQARNAINDILNVLQDFGLMAPP